MKYSIENQLKALPYVKDVYQSITDEDLFIIQDVSLSPVDVNVGCRKITVDKARDLIIKAVSNTKEDDINIILAYLNNLKEPAMYNMLDEVILDLCTREKPSWVLNELKKRINNV